MSLANCLSKANSGKAEVFDQAEVDELNKLANRLYLADMPAGREAAERAAVQQILDEVIAERQTISDLIREAQGGTGEKLSTIAAVNKGDIAPEDVREVVGEGGKPEGGKQVATQDAKPEAEPVKQASKEAGAEKAVADDKKQGKAVENFGEALPPARRAMAAKLDESLSDGDIASRPLSEIWPQAENESIEDTFAAAVAFAARAEIPAKPRVGYKVKQWVAKVQGLRELAAKIVSGRVSRDEFINASGAYSLRDWIGKVKLLEQLPREQWKRVETVEERPDAYTYQDGVQVPAPMLRLVIDGKLHYLRNDGTVAGNMDGISALLDDAAPEKRMEFEIRRHRSGGKYFINKKGDSQHRRLMEFDTAEEARSAISGQYDALVGEWENVKARDNITERDLRTAENRPRVGKDHRGKASRSRVVQAFIERSDADAKAISGLLVRQPIAPHGAGNLNIPGAFGLPNWPNDAGNVNADARKRPSYMAAVSLHLLRDLAKTDAISVQLRGEGNVPLVSAVQEAMLALGHDAQVLSTVVERVPIEVVDFLSNKQLSPESLFRDKTVLKTLLSIDGGMPVGANGNDPVLMLVRKVAGDGTEVLGANDPARVALENDTALVTGKINSGLEQSLFSHDVSPDEFQSVFSFKGGEFGKWVQQGKGDKNRQAILNSAFDALHDLAEIVGVPPSAISLNGTLGIAFGSRGSGWASAHFEPSNLVINLTKTRGAGALAHEWFHALDNYFSRLRGGEVEMSTAGSQKAYRDQNYITHKPEPLMVRKDGKPYERMTLGKLKAMHDARKHQTDAYNPDHWQRDPKHREGVRPEVEQRFAALVDALNESPMTKRARLLDGKKIGDGYWSSTLERAARTFENYVQARMLEDGYHNDFLANVKAANETGKNDARYPYLMPGEIKPISEAFDALFGEIKTKETDTGTAMFSLPGQFNADIDAKEAKQVQAGIEGKTPEEALRFINDNATRPEHRELAARILAQMSSLRMAGMKFTLKVSHVGDRVPSALTHSRGVTWRAFDSSTTDIWIQGADVTGLVGTSYETVLHEMLHAVTQSAIYAGNARIAAGKPIAKNVSDLFGVTNAIISHFNKRVKDVGVDGLSDIEKAIYRGHNAIGSPDEVVSWALTNRDMQAYLESIPYQGKTLWGKFVEAIRSMLGLTAKADTALSEVLRLTDELLNAPANEIMQVMNTLHPPMQINQQAGLLNNTEQPGFIIPVESVQQTVDALTADWKNKPAIVIASDMNDPAIPQKVRDEDEKQKSQGANGEPDGFIYNGTVYLIAGQLRTDADIARVLAHEALGHAGLRGLYGDALAPILKQIVTLRSKDVAAKAKQYGLDVTKEADRLTAAEEVLAEMAQTKPEMGFVKRAIAAIRQWLRARGLKLGLTDADLIASYLLPARAFIERGGKPSANSNAAPAFPAFALGDSLAAKVWRILAGEPIIFQHAMPDSFEMEGAAREIDPGMSAMSDKPDLDEQKTGIVKKWYVKMPDGTHAYVMENKKGEVWIDASRLQEGASGGTKLYLLVGSYAEGNGKVFIGDPAGLSDVALIRRTENMLSLALRFGNTDFLRPHEYQMNPDAKFDTVLADVVRPLEWVEGDNAGNLEELLKTSYANAIDLFPEVKDVTYNFELQRFERDGAAFTDFDGIRRRGVGAIRQRGLAKILSTRKPGGSSGKAEDFTPIGSATLKRAAVLNTVARAARSGRGGELLAEIGRVVPGGLSPLAGILYSRTAIRFSRQSAIPGTTTPQANTIPEETRVQAGQRVVQDQFNRFRVLQDWLKEQGVSLSEKADVYLAETLMSGRISTRKQDFRENQMAQLIEKTQAAGSSMEQVGDYLKAQHAPEANKRARELHGKPDATAYGMSDQDAKDAMDAFKALPGFAQLKALAGEWRDITAQSKKILLDAGILSTEQVAAWGALYSDYVPVKGLDDKPGNGTGKGLGVNGRQKQRMGHGLRDEGIIENILRDHERAISLDEKNRVGHALIRFALEAKNPDIITVGKPVKRQVLQKGQTSYIVTHQGADVAAFDTQADASIYITQEALKGKTKSDFAVAKTTDPVRVMLQASPMLADNEVNVYVAGHAVRVQINDEIAARAYTRMGVEHLNAILSAGREMNTWLSKVYTGYSPDFIFTNPLRDATQGFVTLTGEYGMGMAAKIFGNYPLAMKELINHFRKAGSSAIVDDYRANGGSTGAAYLSDLERIGNDVQAAYNEYAGMLDTYQRTYDQAIDSGKSVAKARTMATLKSGIAGAKRIPLIGHVLRLLERINSVTENALRVATYHTLVQDGVSKPRAAAQAKNLMNFNRKGEISNQAGALYLFFNPAVQGTQVIQKALFDSKHKNQARALAGMMVLSAIALAELAMMGGDDEEDKWNNTPDHVKDGNMVFQFGDYQLTLTLPYGYRVFHVLGNVISDFAHGTKDGYQLGIRMASNVFGNFSPVGNPMEGEHFPFQVLPTAAKMLLGPSVNEDGFGRAIGPMRYSDAKPDSQMLNRATKGSVYSEVAEGLNKLTGGSKYERGMIDVSPETLKYWVRGLTGGAGQFAIDTISAASMATQGAIPQSPKDIPIARRFVREIGVADTRSAFWDRANEAKRAAEEFSAAKRNRDGEAMADIFDEKGPLIALSKYATRQQKMVKALHDEFDRIKNDDNLPLKQKQAQMKLIEIREASVYNRFIEAFDEDTGRKKAVNE